MVYNFEVKKQMMARWFGVMLVVVLICPARVEAYLDPGSGSYLVQMLVATVAGAGLMLGNYHHKIKEFFKKKSEKKR